MILVPSRQSCIGPRPLYTRDNTPTHSLSCMHAARPSVPCRILVCLQRTHRSCTDIVWMCRIMLADSQTFVHAHRRICSYMCFDVCTHAFTLYNTRPHTHTHTYTHLRTHTCTNIQRRTPIHTYTRFPDHILVCFQDGRRCDICHLICNVSEISDFDFD